MFADKIQTHENQIGKNKESNHSGNDFTGAGTGGSRRWRRCEVEYRRHVERKAPVAVEPEVGDGCHRNQHRCNGIVDLFYCIYPSERLPYPGDHQQTRYDGEIARHTAIHWQSVKYDLKKVCSTQALTAVEKQEYRFL